VLPLSQQVIDELFAFMDRAHIGMVDMASFLEILQGEKAPSSPAARAVGAVDNFDWEMEMVAKVRA